MSESKADTDLFPGKGAFRAAGSQRLTQTTRPVCAASSLTVALKATWPKPLRILQARTKHLAARAQQLGAQVAVVVAAVAVLGNVRGLEKGVEEEKLENGRGACRVAKKTALRGTLEVRWRP
jgi:hypothetical protein